MNETGFDTSNFDRIVDLGSLKSGFDKIDIDKPKTAPIDLKNSATLQKKILLKTIDNELGEKVNIIDSGKQNYDKKD